MMKQTSGKTVRAALLSGLLGLGGLFLLSNPAASAAAQDGVKAMDTKMKSGQKPGAVPDMAVSEAEAMVRKYYQTIEMQPFNEGQASEFFSDEYTNYPKRDIAPGSSVKSSTLGLLRSLSHAFPDAKRKLLIVEALSDNRVLVYFSFEGTHSGQFFGFPATGNKVSFIGVDIFRIKDHQFIENWHVEDLSKLFEQLKAR
ncbi:ester cyclase [Undibacterium sp. TS12]|uniref:ester cyclase n=1 Tax=Undibacterium sp. TS12 TaxID=2908202 RepID=UPI001F4CD326|nr:ester cyclase [Undibacterium sp. TS12]MCH8621063.1 ester cyclase [Undibacterium sp. TS12]